MFKRLRLRERAIQYLIKLSSSTPLDNRLVALEGDVAKVQRAVSSRTREEADLSLLVAKVSALQTRVDVISTNVAALRSEVIDASSARQKARQEQLDDAVSAAVRGARETIDARVENVLSLLNSAQTASLAQIGQLLIAQHAVEARIAGLEDLAPRQAGDDDLPSQNAMAGVIDGKISNLLDLMNAAQTALLERIGQLSIAQNALEARLGLIETAQAALPAAMNQVQSAALEPIGNLGVTIHALQARHELLEKAQQQVPEALNRVQGDVLRTLGDISIDVANLKQQVQLVGEAGLTRSEHELATGSLMQIMETAQQASLDLQARQASAVTAVIEDVRQSFQKDLVRFQIDLSSLQAEIAALRNRAQV